MQADAVLELRVLHFAGNRKSVDSHTEESLNKRDLKTQAHNDTFPPARPPLLIVLFPLGAIFFQITTVGLVSLLGFEIV